MFYRIYRDFFQYGFTPSIPASLISSLAKNLQQQELSLPVVINTLLISLISHRQFRINPNGNELKPELDSIIMPACPSMIENPHRHAFSGNW